MPDDEPRLRHTVSNGQTLEDDFCVIRSGRNIGQIRLTSERGNASVTSAWDWAVNIPLPIPPWCVGRTSSLLEAQDAFWLAWEEFHAGLTEHDIQHWHATAHTAPVLIEGRRRFRKH
jgi:hypothetical protein